MNRKPHPTTAARLVHAHLKHLGFVVSDRQSKDLVALVEGYPSWQTFKAAQAKDKAPKVSKEPPPTPYAQAWAALNETLKQRMLLVHNAVLGYFSGAIAQHGMTLWLPIPDTDVDEWSYWMWLEDAQGRSLITAKLALVEDDSDDSEGFSLRFELEAPCENRILMSWVATNRFGPHAWTPLSEIKTLEDQLDADFSGSEVVYAIQDARIFG